ncbi:IclR family transcriptional regulator [Isoptericola sp. BMS4]|uniref:IclR family transcriptional regulator n=1 Tax=Isoptericola sp. BMS4 TaxID=2527875 RepID=UPI00141D9CBB|nr:IclR family transcriptional regulator [Isoptericola sp. BMS4]
MAQPPSPLGSVDKALLTLDALARAGARGLALAELAGEVGANKSTLHRTLAALRHRGYAEQTAAGDYRLGPAVLALGTAFLSEENLPGIVRPALEALRDEVDELVHLGTLAGHEVVYLDKVEPQRPVRVWSAVGRRLPAATTALGRAMLATAPSPAAGDRLSPLLAEARERGYAAETEENEPGIACVAVAVLRAGRPVAAVSVTAPVERLTGDGRAARVAALRDVLSRTLPPGLTIPAPLG